jgi:PAS domain S-box-containing protein
LRRLRPIAHDDGLLREERDIVYNGALLGHLKVELSAARVHRELRGELVKQGAALTAQVVISFALIWLLLDRRLIRPLRRLQAEVSRLARGELDRPIASARDDEIGHLAAGLDTMRTDLAALITRREQAEAALQESDRFVRTITDNIPGMVGYWTRELRCSFANAGYTTWFGRPADEMLGIRMDDLMGDELFAQNEPRLRAAFAGENQKFERLLVQPGGAARWVLAQYIADRRDGETIGIFVSVFDITESKRAQEALQSSVLEKEALLREVHHRVKNNLQLIASLLRLERGRSTHLATASVLGDMQGRIRSMALLHESLYRSGTLASVNLGAYLEQLSGQVFRTLVTRPGAIQLRLSLASVNVGMDQATPCGLLLNELLANSLKHGFADGRGGEIRISLERVSDDRQLRLTVSDTGVGLPPDFEERRKSSLGLKLVSDLTLQLGATLEIGQGATFMVTFTVDEPKTPAAADRPALGEASR